MKAVILAGGPDTVLKPLTNDRPKSFLPLANVPMFEYLLDFMSRSGVEHVIVCTDNRTGWLMKDAFGDGHAGTRWTAPTRIEYIIEDQPKGTAACVKDALPRLGAEPFLVLESGLLLDVDLEELFAKHHQSKALATVAVPQRGEGPNGAERSEGIPVLSSSESNFNDKSYGIYVFDPAAFDFVESGKYWDIKDQLLPDIQRHGQKVARSTLSGYFRKMNQAGDYFAMNRDLLAGYPDYRHIFCRSLREISDGVWADGNVKISEDAFILGPVVIGRGTTIGPKSCVIGPAAVGPDCEIERGAVLREGIVWEGSRLSADSRFEHCIIDSTLPPVSPKVFKSTIVVDNTFSTGELNFCSSDFKLEGITMRLTSLVRDHTKRRVYQISKRALDLAGAMIGLAILLVLLPFLALAIKLESSGPVFFVQRRLGKGRKEFRMFKFRSMVADAEKIKERIDDLNETDGPVFKIQKDPRLTRLGWFLRATSVDELPQFVNVFLGQMSLVGPRPLSKEESRYNEAWADVRTKVKPGITGLWQVQGRGRKSFSQWVKYDIDYVTNQSMKLDLLILFRTFWAQIKSLFTHSE